MTPASLEYSVVLDNRVENPVTGLVAVEVPPNVRTAVEVWSGPALGS